MPDLSLAVSAALMCALAVPAWADEPGDRPAATAEASAWPPHLRLALDTAVVGRYVDNGDAFDRYAVPYSDLGGPSFAVSLGLETGSGPHFRGGFFAAAGTMRLRGACDSNLCGAFHFDTGFAGRLRLPIRGTREIYLALFGGLTILDGRDEYGDGVRAGPQFGALLGFQQSLPSGVGLFVELGWHGYWHWAYYGTRITSQVASLRLGIDLDLGRR